MVQDFFHQQYVDRLHTVYPSQSPVPRRLLVIKNHFGEVQCQNNFHVEASMYLWYLHTIYIYTYYTKLFVYTLKSIYLLHWGQITFWKDKKKHPNTWEFWCYLGSLTLGLCLPKVRHGNASYWAQSQPQHQLSKHDCYLKPAQTPKYTTGHDTGLKPVKNCLTNIDLQCVIYAFCLDATTLMTSIGLSKFTCMFHYP